MEVNSGQANSENARPTRRCRTHLMNTEDIWGWVKTLVPSEPQNSW